MCEYVYVCMHVCVSLCMCLCMCVHLCVYVCICASLCVSVYSIGLLSLLQDSMCVPFLQCCPCQSLALTAFHLVIYASTFCPSLFFDFPCSPQSSVLYSIQAYLLIVNRN